jgi:signal transduction histidine kinase
LATASPFDAALQDVLDRLVSATSQVDLSAEPQVLAEKAADLALRLTRSAHVSVTLGDKIYDRTARSHLSAHEATAAAELRSHGQVLGTITVSRDTAYLESETDALAIFASLVGTAIGATRRAGDAARSTERVERAHDVAVQVLLAVSSHAASGQDLPDFYGRLAQTVGELVGAGKVLFWRLADDASLAPMPSGGYGLDRAFVARLAPTSCTPGGTDLASRVVFGDLIFRAGETDIPPEFAYVLETLGVKNMISVPWRAGEERLGLVAAYDSPRAGGFSREDAWVLQTAGLAAGLVTRLWHTQDELRKSVDRLTKVDGARQMLLKNMTTVVDKERKRFVSELHDDALQKLTAAELQVERLARHSAADAESLETVRDLLRQTEAALRRVVFDVRPPALESPDGLAQSVRDRLAMLAGSGIRHELTLDLPEELTDDDRALIFREVAEAIGNVERHSKATLVKVSLTQADGGLVGVVEDNGTGFVVAERSNLPGHLGLLALRERALMAGGWYKIESRPGAGTRIEFWIPLEH